jgi:hypothetical protein
MTPTRHNRPDPVRRDDSVGNVEGDLLARVNRALCELERRMDMAGDRLDERDASSAARATCDPKLRMH